MQPEPHSRTVHQDDPTNTLSRQVSTPLSLALTLCQYLLNPVVLAAFLSPALLAFFWVACAAEIQSAYWISQYTLGKAFTNALDVGFTRLFEQGEAVWFLPFGAALALGYIGLGLARLRLRRLCLVGALLLPVLPWGRGFLLIFVLSPLFLPPTVLGKMDGEFWGEGWVIYLALSAWLWVWSFLFLLDFRKRHGLPRATGMLGLLVLLGLSVMLLWGPWNRSIIISLETQQAWTRIHWGVLGYLTTTGGSVEFHPWPLVQTLAAFLLVGGPAGYALRMLCRAPQPRCPAAEPA